MEIKLIELYCCLCRLYDNQSVLKHQRLSNFKPRFTDQELVACYFFAMLNNQRTIQEIYDYIRRHWLECFPQLPSYKAFNYRLNNLSTDFAVISSILLREKLLTPNLDFSADSLIDSFPVMMAVGKKSKSCQTAKDLADFGYCASKDIYYYGVKLHNLAIRRRLPLAAACVCISLTCFKTRFDGFQRAKSASSDQEFVRR